MLVLHYLKLNYVLYRDRIFAGESLFGEAIWCGSRDVVHPVVYPGQEKEGTIGVYSHFS